jgi:hypothetical protein
VTARYNTPKPIPRIMIEWGAPNQEPRLLLRGQVAREFATFDAAEKEARRLSGVAGQKGVPWRYWPVQR